MIVGDGNGVEIQGTLEGRREGGDFLTSLEMCNAYPQLRGLQIQSFSSPELSSGERLLNPKVSVFIWAMTS